STERLEQLAQEMKNDGAVRRSRGNFAAAAASAQKVIDNTYLTPYLAHATMEPPAALAVVKDGTCEVWACTQNPQGARNAVAEEIGMPVENVKMNVTLLGGGFGRKSKPDFILEA